MALDLFHRHLQFLSDLGVTDVTGRVALDAVDHLEDVPPNLLRRHWVHPFSPSAMAENCSRAVCRSSAISWARTSGSGKLSASSSVLSLSQKMSRFSLSRLASSSYSKQRHRPSGSSR